MTTLAFALAWPLVTLVAVICAYAFLSEWLPSSAQFAAQDERIRDLEQRIGQIELGRSQRR